MTAPRPVTVVLAVLVVVIQVLVAVVAAVVAVAAPQDDRTVAVTAPAVLILGYAVTAGYLWAGHRWARLVALAVAVIGVVGNLSVILYDDHGTTVVANSIGLVLAVLLLGLLVAPPTVRYFGAVTATRSG
ncbi:hypothetical protein [Nakamurella sp.]|uniref:hypothetical protein n=1 Tax=Nakamurella sp. TaxID=1869182 RepID=UPI003B3B6678